MINPNKTPFLNELCESQDSQDFWCYLPGVEHRTAEDLNDIKVFLDVNDDNELQTIRLEYKQNFSLREYFRTSKVRSTTTIWCVEALIVNDAFVSFHDNILLIRIGNKLINKTKLTKINKNCYTVEWFLQGSKEV